MKDPFDRDDRPAFKKLSATMKWHPRLLAGRLPSFLVDYWVVHFRGSDPLPLAKVVDRLYFSVFFNYSDRSMVVPSVVKGETLAILTPDRKIAVAAVTYEARSGCVVIFFLATLNSFECTGMASHLLSLLFHLIRSGLSTGKRQVEVYLKANPKNESTYRFYENRGFVPMEESASFPQPLMVSFAREDDDEGSPLKDYLLPSSELQWLMKVYKASYVFSKVETVIYDRFFTNPYSIDWDGDPSVYAHLPGGLLLKQLDHCAPDDSSALNHKVFQERDITDRDSVLSPLPGNCPVRVNWLPRCNMLAHRWVDDDIFGLIIAWLQRNAKARIWTECLTIVQVSLMRHISMMHYLFHEYSTAKAMAATGGGDNAYFFNPDIDNDMFMDASIPVMRFIFQNRALFINPYIAFLVEDEVDRTWSTFITLNAGQIGVDQPKDEEAVCGYVHLVPMSQCGGANDDDDDDDDGAVSKTTCVFFLMLAYHVLNSDHPPKSGSQQISHPHLSEDQAIWFQSIEEFDNNIGMRLKEDFGYKEPTLPQSRFVKLSPPPNYPLRTHSHPHMDRLYAFMFLIDFCVSIATAAPIVWGKQVNRKGEVYELSGLGGVLPIVGESRPFIETLTVSMMQVVDRIAATQLGASRTAAEEYFFSGQKAQR